MKIALDASYSLTREPSGVAAYSDNLIRTLTQSAPELELLLCYRPARYLRALRTPLPAGTCSRTVLHSLPCFFQRFGVTLFHGLNQQLPGVRFRRSVTTFHDLSAMSGDFAAPESRARSSKLFEAAAGRSDHIIAVSQYVADQLVERLMYPRARITVVHNGVTPVAAVPEVELRLYRRRQQLEAPFILHVGAIGARKNTRRLLSAFERLPPPTLLVLAGAEGYGAGGLLPRMKGSPAADRIRYLGYVDGETLAKLYRSATVLVLPSLEESFGMPVLEAMSAGLPVVTSKRSALPEVAGDAALLVDPEKINDIVRALERVLESSRLRERLRQAGLARAAKFSWIKAAHETLKVYRKVA